MAGGSSFSFAIDRASGIFDVTVEYYIPGSFDPDTFEQHFGTSWNLSFYGPGGSGSNGGSGWDSGGGWLSLGFPDGDTISEGMVDFYAANSFTGESVGARLQVLNAGLAQTRVVLTAARNLGLADDDAVLIGGSGADALTGARGNDLLDAGGGADTLNGGDGRDILDGGAGGDAMTGGAGDDTYYADDAADTITEADGGGHDLVFAATSFTLGAHVEDLILSGLGALSGTGNALGNAIYGNNDSNVIDGRGGNDQLFGYGGNDRLVGGEGHDELDGGLGRDQMAGGAGNDVYLVDDVGDTIAEAAGGGTDEARVSGVSGYQIAANVEILTNLGTAPYFSGWGNGIDNVLTGGAGVDALHGLAGTDELFGGEGNDVLEGGLGADRLEGGIGLDTASYARAAASVTAHLGGLPGAGEAAGDTFSGIENLVGSRFADFLTGNNADNRLVGGEGDDQLVGGGGLDWLVGGRGADQLLGDGNDAVSYANSDAAVTVDLGLQSASGGEAAGDILVGIAHAEGSAFADRLTGNTDANVLLGAGGEDVIDGADGNDRVRGGAGADTMRGGGGFDTLDYWHSDAAVTVNLLTGTASGGHATGDSFSWFEQVAGSAHNDVLTAGNTGHYLLGWGGDDTLTGGTGNDTLVGGAGVDAMDGGSGTDTLSYATSQSYLTIDLATGQTFGLDAEGDTFTGFENLQGGMVSDALYGDAARNVIWGFAGGDYIDGRGGDDLLIGGSGDDGYAFRPDSGFDRIRDFTAGGTEDRLILTAMGPFFATFEQVIAAARQVGVNTVITFGAGNGIVLEGVTLAALTTADFVF